LPPSIEPLAPEKQKKKNIRKTYSKLGVRFTGIGDETNTTTGKYPDAVDLPELLEVPRDNLFNIIYNDSR